MKKGVIFFLLLFFVFNASAQNLNNSLNETNSTASITGNVQHSPAESQSSFFGLFILAMMIVSAILAYVIFHYVSKKRMMSEIGDIEIVEG